MVNQNRNHGFVHPVLLIVLLVVVAAIGWTAFTVRKDNQQHQKAVNTERALYAQLATEAQEYIQTINAKYPGDVKHTKSCSYTSTEVGTGALGCDVESKVVYSDQKDSRPIFSYADSTLSELSWGKGEDATQENAKTIHNLQKDMLYRRDDKVSCSVSYYEEQSSLLIIIARCGGGALAEYYPVVND